MAVAAALLGACGDDPADEQPQVQAPASTTSTTAAPAARTYSAELTTTDGRYTVTLLVGVRAPADVVEDCPSGPATAGRYVLPVTLTVANSSTDRAAPFPPLRVEMTTAPGSRPGQVLLKDGAGTCTFAPRAASIAPGAAAVFRGTSPAIDEAAAPGTAGRIEVKVSESTFTLAAPVP